VASAFDESDFVDRDFQAGQRVVSAPSAGHVSDRVDTREELENRVSDTHRRLQELKRVQEQLERERASLEEARRRRAEYQMGREEMLQHLTRGVGLLEEAEFAARRDAEQLAKTLADLREAQVKVQSLNDQSWSEASYNEDLTRALTTLENARMEWNSAQLKWPVLSENATPDDETEDAPDSQAGSPLASLSFLQLGKVGLGLTWPLVLMGLVALVVWLVVLVNS